MINKPNSKIVFPDYNNCIINLISSILNTYSVKTNHKPLHYVPSNELKTKQNIVLLVFDGMGYEYLKQHGKRTDSYLYDNLKTSITTVFPSTTTAVITGILTGKTPIEHGAIGWTLFYKEYQKYVDYLPNRDSITQQELYSPTYDIYGLMNHETIFQQIRKANKDVQLYQAIPQDLSNSKFNIDYSKPAEVIPYQHTKDMLDEIERKIKVNPNTNKFIYGYSINPDAIFHKRSLGSREAFSFINKINQWIKRFIEKLSGTNTRIIITADHGLVDIHHYYYIDKDKELYNCLITPPFPESRFLSFFVKPHRQKQFERIMKTKFNNRILLYDRKSFLKSGLLGKGNPHPKIDDFIGNYIGIGIDDLGFKTLPKQKYHENENEFKAHHAGLTREEMLIPLIVLDAD
jgi:hypothetical protein